MPAAAQTLLADIRRTLAARADAARAGAMQRYMKSVMPYLGVSMPGVDAACREVYARHRLPTFEAWQATVLALWREAAFREERYAALRLTTHRAYDDHQRMAALPLYRELIVTGAWWDYVDATAHRIGDLLRRHPGPMGKTLRAWARHDDMWLRRVSIIAQLDFKQHTDLVLLYDCIAPSIDSKEFFLRKAIGWALRQYARVDPREALRFVTEHRARLSSLTKREALKAQLRSGAVTRVP